MELFSDVVADVVLEIIVQEGQIKAKLNIKMFDQKQKYQVLNGARVYIFLKTNECLD